MGKGRSILGGVLQAAMFKKTTNGKVPRPGIVNRSGPDWRGRASVTPVTGQQARTQEARKG